MIKPEFWNDEKLGSESESVQLTYIGTWTFSDDYGVVKGNPIWLKNQIFPYKQALRIELFSKWLEALEGQDMLIPFTLRGEKFYCIRTFRQYQSVEKPSKTRNCTEQELRETLESMGYHLSTEGAWVRVPEQSGKTPRPLPDEVKRSVTGSKVNRAKALVIASDDPGHQIRAEYKNLIEELDSEKDRVQVWNRMKEFVQTKKPNFFEPYLDLWNIFAISTKLIAEPQRITEKRVKKFKTRIMEPGFDFLKILEKIKTSNFLKGNNQNGWTVSIEFILESEENYTKILEGKYA